jgi:hypothetical protein
VNPGTRLVRRDGVAGEVVRVWDDALSRIVHHVEIMLESGAVITVPRRELWRDWRRP